MEQFSLEKYLENPTRKVVTRDGRPVRILCTDAKAKDGCCIIAAIETDGEEEGYQFFKNGKAYSSKSSIEDCADLFFADEEEGLTELQKTLEEDCDCYVNLYKDGKTREELRDWIKCWCPRIIDLARKKVLKDLPKWKDVSGKNGAGTKDYKIVGYYLVKGNYAIYLEDLEKLPKE